MADVNKLSHVNSIPTPHIACDNPADIAETVLLPGDPLRAKFIAETFLTDVKQFNGTRNMLGYTGNYNGKRVSVMGSGMGSCTTSNYVRQFGLPGDYAPICSYELLSKAVKSAEDKGFRYHVGNILSIH